MLEGDQGKTRAQSVNVTPPNSSSQTNQLPNLSRWHGIAYGLSGRSQFDKFGQIPFAPLITVKFGFIAQVNPLDPFTAVRSALADGKRRADANQETHNRS
jgi:hypothetical protein